MKTDKERPVKAEIKSSSRKKTTLCCITKGGGFGPLLVLIRDASDFNPRIHYWSIGIVKLSVTHHDPCLSIRRLQVMGFYSIIRQNWMRRWFHSLPPVKSLIHELLNPVLHRQRNSVPNVCMLLDLYSLNVSHTCLILEQRNGYTFNFNFKYLSQ